MEHILDQLTAHLDTAPDDDIALLRATIDVLQHVQRHPHGPHPVSWEALHRDFERLRDHGLWQHNTENDELLDALRVLLTSPSAQKPVEVRQGRPFAEKISIVVPPPQSVLSKLVSNQDPLVCPVELIDILNNTYFLHMLATDPAQVLPPGKSLLSVMSRSHTIVDGDTKPTLHTKVEDIVYKAFWDEAVSTLSKPEPSAQLPRMKLLYEDLYVALSPLLPPKHPVLVTLSSPLSPTSSPLDSALMHLREVLASLRQRCAPVRDPEIEALQRSLDDPPAQSSHLTALAALVAETVRGTLKLSEVMKDDLSQFILGSMTEQQLGSVIAKQAKATEQEIVIDIWHRDRMLQGWTSWLDRLQPSAHLNSISAAPRFLWIVRIVQALGSSLPVSCPLPSRSVEISPSTSSDHDSEGTAESPAADVNTLPPVFFFSAPTLLKIQDYLQALVIGASLHSLVYPPTPAYPSRTSSEPPGSDSFMSRIWTLLRAEISREPDAGDTKLINLADEVVRARTQVAAAHPTPSTVSKEDEAMLRAAVDRTLRYEDPVYKLLQRRLLTELCNVLVKRRQGDAARGAGPGPATLRTGTGGERAGKRPRLVLDPEDMDDSSTPPHSLLQIITVVKGFEDPVLSQAIVEVFEQVDNCLWWAEKVWADVFEMGDVIDIDSSPRKSGTFTST